MRFGDLAKKHYSSRVPSARTARPASARPLARRRGERTRALGFGGVGAAARLAQGRLEHRDDRVVRQPLWEARVAVGRAAQVLVRGDVVRVAQGDACDDERLEAACNL